MTEKCKREDGTTCGRGRHYYSDPTLKTNPVCQLPPVCWTCDAPIHVGNENWAHSEAPIVSPADGTEPKPGQERCDWRAAIDALVGATEEEIQIVKIGCPVRGAKGLCKCQEPHPLAEPYPHHAGSAPITPCPGPDCEQRKGERRLRTCHHYIFIDEHCQDCDAPFEPRRVIADRRKPQAEPKPHPHTTIGDKLLDYGLFKKRPSTQAEPKPSERYSTSFISSPEVKKAQRVLNEEFQKVVEASAVRPKPPGAGLVERLRGRGEPGTESGIWIRAGHDEFAAIILAAKSRLECEAAAEIERLEAAVEHLQTCNGYIKTNDAFRNPRCRDQAHKV